MPDVSAEQEKTRAEVAEYLRAFADELSPQETNSANDRRERTNTAEDRAGEDRSIDDDRGPATGSERRSGADDSRTTDGTTDTGKVTIIVGNESATMKPPETVLFGVEADTEDSLLGATGERGVTFSLTWSEADVETDEEFTVE